MQGDVKVHMWIDQTDNPDGTTTVTTRQHTHGSQLRGVLSGDKYNFNESQDVVETFLFDTTLGGMITVQTRFIHNGERHAAGEVPGEDDLIQDTTFTIGPLGEVVQTSQQTECK